MSWTGLPEFKDDTVTDYKVKKDVSSLRYITLPNWIHEVHLESSSSQPQKTCNFDKPTSSGNSNPTATSTNPPADQLETLIVETSIPPVSSPVPTACLNDSPEPSNHLGKFEAKGDAGYFIGYKGSCKSRCEERCTFLRYIDLPNWFHEVHLESSSSKPQDAYNANAPESNRNSNPTATSTNPPADQMETLIVETPIPTVSSPVPTSCLNDSPEPSSDTRLISKRVTNQEETPSLDNILTLSNRFEDILGVTTNSDDTHGVEADVSNMKSSITASPTPTFKIHKDHPKSQIIGPVDTPIQTRNKTKEMEEQSFIATIHHMTNLDLLQFCLFSCFLSQEEPKKIFDALKDPRWVEAMQEELFNSKSRMFELWLIVLKGLGPLG
nr:hypothetical protein [Tanacetum cinerariifolium]